MRRTRPQVPPFAAKKGHKLPSSRLEVQERFDFGPILDRFSCEECSPGAARPLFAWEDCALLPMTVPGASLQ